MKLLLLSLLSYLLLGCWISSCAQTPVTQQPSKPAYGSGSVGVERVVNWTEAQPGIPKGKVETVTLDDKEYKRKRRIWVYTPPDYNQKSSVPYRLLICFDGLTYTSEIPLPTILDNLLAAGKIWPTIAVMIDNEEARLEDLANRQSFATFMGNELLPWVRNNYHVTTEANKTILCGYSAGGLAAAYVAWKRPELFGNVLSQSGAFWRGNEGGMDTTEWLTQQFKDSPKLDIHFYIEVGALETGKTAGGTVFIEATRHLHQVLQAKGYDVRYLEVEGARHEPAHWRAELAAGIIYLSGRVSQTSTP